MALSIRARSAVAACVLAMTMLPTGESGYDQAEGLAVAADGNTLFVVGTSSHATSDGPGDNLNRSAWDYMMIAYETVDGDQDWARRHNGTANGRDDAYGVVPSPDNSRIFVTGRTCETGLCIADEPGDYNWTTLALNASNGNLVWKKFMAGSAAGNDEAYSIAINPNGTRIYVVGVSESSSNGDDFKIVCYAASNGALKWSATYDGPASATDHGLYVAVSPDGTRVAITGESLGTGGTDQDFATLVYNAWSGSHVWTMRYDGTGSGNDVPAAVAFSDDSDTVYVAGTSLGSGAAGKDYFTIAYETSDGDVVWSNRKAGPGVSGNFDDEILGLVVDPDGDAVYVTGDSRQSTATGVDFWTFSYNEATGADIWNATFNRDVLFQTSSDWAWGIAVAPDGERVVVVGQSDELSGFGKYDYTTIAYNANTGAQQWVKHYDGTGANQDVAQEVVISPDDDEVYVTGTSWGLNSANDFATIAYEAIDGDQIWVQRFNGAASDGILGELV